MLNAQTKYTTGFGPIGLIVGVSCLLCSSALPGVWSFLRVTPQVASAREPALRVCVCSVAVSVVQVICRSSQCIGLPL